MASPRSFSAMVDAMNMKTYGTTNPGMLPVGIHREPEIVMPPSKEPKIVIASTPSGSSFDWAKLLAETPLATGVLGDWKKGDFEQEYLTKFSPSHAGTTTATAGTGKSASRDDITDAMNAAITSLSGYKYNSALTTSAIEAVVPNPPVETPSDHPEFGSW